MKIEGEQLTAVQTKFKELGLSQTQAQGLIDFQLAREQSTPNAAYQAYLDQRKAWRTEAEAGLQSAGLKVTEARSDIAKMLNGTLNADENRAFRQAMDFTGVGDHPGFVLGFAKLAGRFKEGQPTQGAGPSEAGQGSAAAPKSAAQRLFPGLPSAVA